MLLSTLLNTISSDWPDLYATLMLTDLIRFATLAAEVYARTKEAWHLSPESADDIVPFLQASLDLSLPSNLWHRLWRLLFPVISQTRIDPGILIQRKGYRPELNTTIPEFFLTPPMKRCLLCTPSPSSPAIKLQHRSHIDAYLYDIDGVHTTRVFTMKCPKCTAHYRPSYYSLKGLRTYYSGQDGRNQNVYQVSCHFFMTHRLAEFLRTASMLAHVSNFNLVNLFNESYVEGMSIPALRGAPMVKPSMSEVTCADGLDIHDLLTEADSALTHLVVDSSAPSENRYHLPMQHVLEWNALEGTTHRDHVCSSCVRLVDLANEGQEPKLGYIRAVVTDGVTIGHWRCSATSDQLRDLAEADGLPSPHGPCTAPLDRVSDRFCREHQKRLGLFCQAQPCLSLAEEGSATCKLQEHVDAYAQFKSRVTSNFALTSMLNRPGSNRPSDPTVHQDWNTAEMVDLKNIQDADEGERSHEAAREGEDAPKKNGKRVCLSRKKTHNEQLVVSVCGIILARETFFHSESLSAVRAFLLRTFPKRMPQVCFYDSACKLVDHIYHGGEDKTPFLETVFPVDPFHFRGHKDTDEFCQHYTDPKLFPDLRDEGGWVFNSSAAEMTNVWYGGFASIARNMHAVRFNFFMEQMVKRRNNWLIRRLHKRETISFIGDLPV